MTSLEVKCAVSFLNVTYVSCDTHVPTCVDAFIFFITEEETAPEREIGFFKVTSQVERGPGSQPQLLNSTGALEKFLREISQEKKLPFPGTPRLEALPISQQSQKAMKSPSPSSLP